MNTWEAHLLIAQRYMHRSITLPFVVYPKYLLEFLLALLALCILVYLSLEVWRARRYLQNYIRPHSIQFKQSLRQFNGAFSNGSITTSIVRCEFINPRGRRRRTLSKMSWLTENREEFAELFGGEFRLSEDRTRRRLFVDKLTALTPSQYVRLDKEEQMRNLQTVGCMRSLTTLFNNVMQQRLGEPQMRAELDAAKEDCECSAVSHQLMQYLDSERVTDSLIDVLNDIIEDTNADNPLPMSGELTALVYDIGNLKDRVATIFESAFDATGSSATTTTASDAGPAS